MSALREHRIFKSLMGYQGLNAPYGRGRGLSTAAFSLVKPDFKGWLSRAMRGLHLGGQLGANWGPINSMGASLTPVGGGRRG